MKKYSSYLLSLMFSMGIPIGALTASTGDFGRDLTQNLDHSIPSAPEVEISIIPSQACADCALQQEHNHIELSMISETLLPNYSSIATISGELENFTDLGTRIPMVPKLLPSTRLPTLPQIYISLDTPTTNNGTTPAAVNQIATPTQPIVLPKNSTHSTSKDKSSSNKKYVGQNMLEYLPVDTNKFDMQCVRRIAPLVGRVSSKDIGETGFLNSFITWLTNYEKLNQKLIAQSAHPQSDNQDIQERKSIDHLRYTVNKLSERLQHSIQSLNASALDCLSEKDSSVYTNLLQDLMLKYRGRPKIILENALSRLNGDTARKVVLPTPFPDPQTLRLLPKISEEEMPQDRVNEAIGILSSIGNSRYSSQSASGWLPLITRASTGNTLHLSHLLELQKSLNQNTLTDITDEFGKDAVMQYLPLLAQKYLQPIRQFIENALGRFNGEETALAAVPLTYKNAVPKSRKPGRSSKKKRQETNTTATQMTTASVSSHAVSLVMSSGSSQITHKPDEGTMHALVEQEKTPTSEPSSPSTSDKGAIEPDYDIPSTLIDLSTSEPHGINDMAFNDQHMDGYLGTKFQSIGTRWNRN